MQNNKGPIVTELTEMFGVKHPVCSFKMLQDIDKLIKPRQIMLAGMNVSGAQLAAAVANAGGMAVMGGVGYS